MIKLLLLAVLLTWNDNSNNENGFVIERSLDCITFDVVGYTGIGVASFTDAMSIDKSCYRVAAFNDAGVSGYSNVAQYLAPAPRPCKGRKCHR